MEMTWGKSRRSLQVSVISHAASAPATFICQEPLATHIVVAKQRGISTRLHSFAATCMVWKSARTKPRPTFRRANRFLDFILRFVFHLPTCELWLKCFLLVYILQMYLEPQTGLNSSSDNSRFLKLVQQSPYDKPSRRKAFDLVFATP